MAVRPANWTDDQPSAEPAPTGTQIEDGSEGISFAVLDSETAAPDLWSGWAEVNQLETVPLQQRCTLSFAFPPTAIPVPVFPDGENRTQPLASRVLQLPVANTLFKNGKLPTLTVQRWKSRGSIKSSCTLSCTQKAKLSQQTLRLTGLFSDQSTGLNQSLHSHLIPITPTRTITAAIGNIIRRISVNGTSNEGVPASEELEQAISAAIKDGRMPAEQAGIWALVKPPNYSSPAQSGGDIGGAETNEIQQAVMTGCQLHKVLSGGGGWGEKRGLLALDPDYGYHRSQQGFVPSDWVEKGVEPGSMQSFGELVNPGDTVRFFIYRSPQILGSTSEVAPKHDSATNLKSLSLKFGSLPSNTDAMPNVPINETDSSSQPSCMAIRHHFGMLSEQGMSLESTFVETDLRARKVPYLIPKLLGRGLPRFEVLDELVLTTKLDAPYMTWSIEEDLQAADPTSAVSWSRPQSLSEYAYDKSSEKRTTTVIGAIESTMMRSHEGKSEALDDIMEAIGTMPSHQHIATMGPHPRDRRRAEGKAGGEAYSKALGTSHKVAMRLGRRAKTLIRIFKHAGPEVGAVSFPLSKLSQVQSRIKGWVKRSGERRDATEQLKRHDDNACQSDKMEVAHVSQQPPDDTKSVRIRKHVAKLPSMMEQRLGSSVRRSIILGASLLEEYDVVTKRTIAGSDSEDSVRNEQQSAMENEPQIEPEASRVNFIPESLQETLPFSQSEIKTETGEQLETPLSESPIRPALMERRTHPEQLRRDSGRVTRKVAGLVQPMVTVRKYLGRNQRDDHNDQRASYNSRMAANRIEGLLQKKESRGLPTSKEWSILMDPTQDDSPAHKKLRNMQVRTHLSHEAPPTDARNKAKKLHKEYHLPLLDERPDDAPRP